MAIKRLPPPWVFVTTGIIFNILSAVITHYFIGVNNEKITALDREANNKQVLIDSLWQSKTEIERKKEFFILLLTSHWEGKPSARSSLVEQFYRDYLDQTVSTYSLTDFKNIGENAMADTGILLAVSESAQNSIIDSINSTYFEKSELEDSKIPIERNNARLFSIAIFLQVIGLILVLARDLSKR